MIEVGGGGGASSGFGIITSPRPPSDQEDTVKTFKIPVILASWTPLV